MAIETVNYISDLNLTNPPDGDPVSQAAAHLRLIKSALKTTFPNLSGIVNSTQENINNGNVPTGFVGLWSGSSASIPTGWALCDGGTHAKMDGSGNLVAPNLTDKFVIGAGATYAPGATGGAASNTPTITVAGHALTTAELAVHNHPIIDAGHVHGVSDPGHFHAYTAPAGYANSFGGGGAGALTAFNGTNTGAKFTGITINSATAGVTVDNNGSGTAHTHGATSSAVPTLPPYYALCYIIRL